MEEPQKVKQQERFYLDVMNDTESWVEVDWNDAAFRDDMIRICIRKDLDHLENYDTAIVRREDLETILFALTKDPSRYVRSSARKVGVRYMPVPERLYREYQEFRKAKAQGKFIKSLY